MDSENAKLRRALAHLIRVVEQRCADIVDVVHSAFQPVSGEKPCSCRAAEVRQWLVEEVSWLTVEACEFVNIFHTIQILCHVFSTIITHNIKCNVIYFVHFEIINEP